MIKQHNYKFWVVLPDTATSEFAETPFFVLVVDSFDVWVAVAEFLFI